MVRKMINFFMPSKQKVRTIDTRLFYLFEEFNIRDFVVMKIILLCCSVVLSVSIIATNYYNSKAKVFTKNRGIAFTITEADYLALTEGIEFQAMDRLKEQNVIMSNSQKLANYQRYLTVDSATLYDVLISIKKDLSSIGGLKLIVHFIVIVAMIMYAPDVILWQLNKVLMKDIDFEFAKLESYIYANSHKKVELVLRGLSYEAVIFRKYFLVFLSRYREDREKAFDLIINSPGIHEKFKQLVEYLLLLQNTDTDRVRGKILVHQNNHMSIVKSSIMSSLRTKGSICNVLIYGSLFLAIGGIIVGIVTNLNVGGVM